VITQLITPNPNIPAEEGMCLQYVRQAFGLPLRYGSATEAWNNSPSQHRDRNYPQGVWFPVWWALDKNVNGHVALVAPDGSVYSTSNLNPNPVKHHPSIADVEAYYAYYGMTLTYRGWSEDVAGYPVISLDSDSINFDSTPSPEEDMPLTLGDLQAIQSLIQTERTTIVNEVRANTGAVGARLDKGIVISREQAEDIVSAATARVSDYVGRATSSLAASVKAQSIQPLDVNALAAQLAPLLNAYQAEQFMIALRAQINK